jgi:hypothetical protein
VTTMLTVSYPYGLAVIALSEGEWRISDRSRCSEDPFCLIAFVRRADGLFEVVPAGAYAACSPPGTRERFLALDETLKHLAAVSAKTDNESEDARQTFPGNGPSRSRFRTHGSTGRCRILGSEESVLHLDGHPWHVQTR